MTYYHLTTHWASKPEKWALLAILTLYWAVTNPNPALAGYVDANSCGAIGQPTCELSSAKKHGKVIAPNPGGGAFARIIEQEWWKCPSSHPNQVLLATSKSGACETNVPLVQTTAGEPFRHGNTIWQCPSTHKTRSTLAVDGGEACETNVPVVVTTAGDPFRHGNEIWQCPGSHKHRTVNSITGSCACGGNVVEGFCNPPLGIGAGNYSRANKIGDTFTSATRVGSVTADAIYVGPLKNARPNGAFEDPRLDLDINPLNIANDEYWSCPTGFWRNLNPITHESACTVDIGKNCDSGAIAVGTPWGGYRCEEWGVCGAKGQRPCQIVERIPSCDANLAEDFVDHVCVDQELAQCLTMTRLTWLAKEGSDAANDIVAKMQEPTEMMLEEIFDALPSEVRSTLENGQAEIEAKVLGPINDKVNEGFELVLSQLATGGTGNPLLEMQKKVKANASGIIDLFADPKTCTATKEELIAKLDGLFGSPDLASIKLAAASPTPWYQHIFNAIEKSAHAEVATADLIYGMAGVNTQIVLGKAFGGGITFEIFVIWGHDDVGLGMALGGIAAFNNPVFSVNAFGGFKSAQNFEDIGGVSVPISFQVKEPKSGVEVGMSMGLRDPEAISKGRHPIESLTFSGGWGTKGTVVVKGETEDPKTKKMTKKKTINLGRKVTDKKSGIPIPLEISVGTNYEWLLAGNNAPEVKESTVGIAKPTSGMCATDIAVSGNGQAWVIGCDAVPGGHSVYQLANDKWQKVPAGAVRIGVDKNGIPWVVNDGGKLFQGSDANGSSWNHIDACAKDVGVSDDTWVIGCNDTPGGKAVYHRVGNTWKGIAGGAVRLDVDKSGIPWLVNDGGKIFRGKDANGSNWILVDGCAGDIGVGDELWVVGCNDAPSGGKSIYHRVGDTWKGFAIGAVAIDVDENGIPWFVNDAGKIFKGNDASGSGWTPVMDF